jgi:hypothetical protein
MREFRHVVCVIAVASIFVMEASSQGPMVLHAGGLWSNYATVESVIWTNPPANQEAADDFNVSGTITRVVANGSGCWQCAPPALAGVWVRFYASQSGAPGALQYQAFVAAGSPQLQYNPADIEVIDVTLPTPFFASGQHFVSVQASFVVAGYWSIWVSNYNAPVGSRVKFRDNLVSSTWGDYSSISIPSLNSDLYIQLWGYPSTPPSQPTDPCGAWDLFSPAPPAASYHTFVRDLKVVGPFDVWAVGDATVGTIGNLSTRNAAWHWDGSVWTETATPNPGIPGSPNNTLYAVDAAAWNDVYAAGFQTTNAAGGGWYGQQLEVLHWDGGQWSLLSNVPMPPNTIGAGVTGAHVNDVDVLAPNEVWFAGFWIELFPTGTTTQPGLLMRYDGSSFTRTTPPTVVPLSTQGQNFTTIHAVATNDVWAAGHRYGLSSPAVPTGLPLLVRWNGSQWSSVSPPWPGSPAVVADIASFGSNNLWILGYQSATPFLLHWNGSSWTTLPAAPSGASSLKAFGPTDLYAGGAGVWHFDGTSWTPIQTFSTLDSASFATIDGVAPCQLWGGGGQWVLGHGVPFVARQPSQYAFASQRNGCLATGTPGALVPLSQPKLGGYFTVGLADPSLALPAAGSGASYWVASAAQVWAAGCGAPLAGGGLNSGLGEVLVDLSAIVLTSGPLPWSGGATYSVHTHFIPNDPALAGVRAYTQGALLDGGSLGGFILTPALDVRLGY